jgi:murein DD-endopeptidase MepM/ murein hydrolase activator NlpD
MVAFAVAGCSSGVSRFDFPAFNLTDNDTSDADLTTTSSLPVPSETVYSPERYHYYGDKQQSNLPPPQSTAAYTPKRQPRSYGTQPAPKPQMASGPRIKVQSGDTLSSLSRRYGVSVETIQTANNLPDARLREGQELIMPGGKMAAAAPTPKPGKKSGVRKVKTTTIPAPGAASGAAKSTEAKASPEVTGKASPQSIASTEQLPSPDPLSGASFRWPVKGRIISGFGTKPDGGHNDGVNISVPQGTSVKAAENGVVAYAGNELKGYGNLVLVRHANNWVSAYANNEAILVKRGDKVRRGQVIAKAGTTGSVSQPQVHFELRKGSRPVDPTKYMSSMAAQAD